MRLKRQGGYVALISTMIVGAVCLSIAVAMLLTGTDTQQMTLVQQKSVQVRALATSCAEEALHKIRYIQNFTGSGGVSTANATCTYTVTTVDSTTRKVVASATSKESTHEIEVYAKILPASISIASWRE